MGSLLDAFGIYGNYRGKDSEKTPVGGEGFIDDSQLMFFQDRYFIQISSSGKSEPGRSAYVACAKALASRLPTGAGYPAELQFLDVQGIVKGTEKYYPQGLLGYAFFSRGLTAETQAAGIQGKLFLVLAASTEDARRALDRYDAYLKESGTPGLKKADRAGASLAGTDPLYKGVLVKQHGAFVVGVTGVKDRLPAEQLIDGVTTRLPQN